MLTIKFFVGILMVCGFVLMFLANISTTQKRRMKFLSIWLFVCLGCVYLIYKERAVSGQLNLLFAFAFIWPHVFSQIYIQNNLKSPIEYMNRNLSAGWIIGVIALLVFVAGFTWMVMLPNRISFETGEGVYDDRDIQFKISVLLLTIPVVPLSIMFLLQRIAFCANGLFYQGGLYDWSNFKEYKWENEEMYRDVEANLLLDKNSVVELTLIPGNVKPFPFVQLHYAIPYSNKETIDKILKQAFSS